MKYAILEIHGETARIISTHEKKADAISLALGKPVIPIFKPRVRSGSSIPMWLVHERLKIMGKRL